MTATLLMLGAVVATVVRVVDGDTLHVRRGGADVTVRLLGIDCPESHRNRNRHCAKHAGGCEAELPRGQAAAERARELLRPGDQVALEDVAGVDRYGRTLARVRLGDGRDYGELMLREGWCPRYVR